MKNLLLLTVAAVMIITGCSGEAEVRIRNNTSCYVNGTIDGQPYGVNPNGTTSRTVEVGGFLKNGSDITTVALVHANYSASSRVVNRMERTDNVPKESVLIIDVFNTNGTFKLTPSALEPPMPSVAP